MPKDHARKNRLTVLKTCYGVRHADAIALLDHPDPGERQVLCELIAVYRDVTTYKDALAALADHRADPRWQELDDQELGDDPSFSCHRCQFGDGSLHCCRCGAGNEQDCACTG